MSEQSRPASKPGKPYVPPKIVDYGSTSKLSATKPGTSNDGASVSKKNCL